VAVPECLSLVYHAEEPYPRDVPLASVYARLDVVPPAGRPPVILNMVQTLDGAVAIDGKAWPIGSAVDHYLFRTLRGWADVVLSGAGTLRLNDVVVATHPHLQARRLADGRPANPTGVVLSRRAAFPDDVLRKRFFTDHESPSVVVTTDRIQEADRRRIEGAGAEVWVAPATPRGDVDLARVLTMFADRRLTRVLAEGGPGMNRHLAEAQAIDEIFLTVVPRVAGVPGSPRIVAGTLGGAQARLTLVSEYQWRAPRLQEWYFRFRVASLEPVAE
jgi:riboflavin biosynthesis pyrimidine reductase